MSFRNSILLLIAAVVFNVNAQPAPCADILQSPTFFGKLLDVESLFRFVTVVKQVKQSNKDSEAVRRVRIRCKLHNSNKPISIGSGSIFSYDASGVEQFKKICNKLRPQVESFRNGLKAIENKAKTQNQQAVVAALRLAFTMMQPPYCDQCPCVTNESDLCFLSTGQKDSSGFCKFMPDSPSVCGQRRGDVYLAADKPLDVPTLFDYVTVVKRVKKGNQKSKAVIQARKECGMIRQLPIYENSKEGLQKYKNECKKLRPQIERYRKTPGLLAKASLDKAVVAAVRLGFDMMQPPFCGKCPCITDENDNCVGNIGEEDANGVCQFVGSTSPSPEAPKAAKTETTLLIGKDDDLSVLDCTTSQLFMKVNSTKFVQPGKIVWTMADRANSLCAKCSSVVRKVKSWEYRKSFQGSECPSGMRCVLVQTLYVTYADIFSKESLAEAGFQNVASNPVETDFECDSSSTSRKSTMETAASRQLSLVGRSVPSLCKAFYTEVDSEGRCLYSNCVVGSRRNAINCLECKDKCNNGCGGDDWTRIVPETISGVFDFSQACCVHDNCYTSLFSKAECDEAFLRQNLGSCPLFSLDISFGISLQIELPLGELAIPSFQSPSFDLSVGILTQVRGVRCMLASYVYYWAVKGLGRRNYEEAQQKREEHEKSEQCLAKCPTTQDSGGFGKYSIPVDVGKSKGSFELQYNTHTVPDELDVFYEGKKIYSTNGLVSTVTNRVEQLAISGKETVVTVVINAPSRSTAWRMSVGCIL